MRFLREGGTLRDQMTSPQPGEPTERKRALVVDDDDPIRAMLAKVVERQNLSVDTARDGVEAIERIDHRDDYALILLDLMMPRLDGYGVLQHLQAHHPSMLKCTIIASAVPESEVLRKFDMPVFKIHAKPFDMSKLIADIHECTDD
jgi:CheY-like chemotaxis protein